MALPAEEVIGARRKAQGMEKISFLGLFLPCALCLEPCAFPLGQLKAKAWIQY
jgi:hypothetical protein